MSANYYYTFSNKQYQEKQKMNAINPKIKILKKVLVRGTWKYYTDQINEKNIETYLKRYPDAEIVLHSDCAKTMG